MLCKQVTKQLPIVGLNFEKKKKRILKIWEVIYQNNNSSYL